ncbi:unnamed protein product [Ilex paraguariensis]|uniref:Pectinesterase inhibitor domain-containing protein n=1 Tax=Ilex paraguariensis TaxID=185542 RepID=A0ABC8SIT8_9AQUA
MAKLDSDGSFGWYLLKGNSKGKKAHMNFLGVTSCQSSAQPGGHRDSRVRAYVEGQCRATLYPKLCVQCLTSYVNSTLKTPQQLAQIALTVSLARARYTQVYVTLVAKQLNQTKARDYQAVKDCLDQINDGVDQISQSIKELQRMGLVGEEEFGWHESNVRTWVSTALTDATTCIDGFYGSAMDGKVKATIKAKVLNVAQLTSNALALFNRFAARHRRASGATTHWP